MSQVTLNIELAPHDPSRPDDMWVLTATGDSDLTEEFYSEEEAEEYASKIEEDCIKAGIEVVWE